MSLQRKRDLRYGDKGQRLNQGCDSMLRFYYVSFFTDVRGETLCKLRKGKQLTVEEWILSHPVKS